MRKVHFFSYNFSGDTMCGIKKCKLFNDSWVKTSDTVCTIDP